LCFSVKLPDEVVLEQLQLSCDLEAMSLKM
jgi:hypothetical protein